jgi:hypothetical protein
MRLSSLLRSIVVLSAAVLFALLSTDGSYAAAKKGAMADYPKSGRTRCHKGICQTGSWVAAPIPGKNCTGPVGYKGKNYFCPDKS